MGERVKVEDDILALGPAGLAGAVADLVTRYERGQPVVRSNTTGGEVVFLVGPELNRQVLASDRDAFTHEDGWAPIFGHPLNLVSADGEEHAAARRAAAPAFTAERTDRYLPLIDELVRERIEAWVDLPVVDVYEETLRLTFDLAARAFLGVTSESDLEAIRSDFLPGHRGAVDLPRGAGELVVRRLIAERRERPVDDALGLLTAHRHAEERAATDAELMAHARFLLDAGFETTANLGAWALHLLAANSDYEARAVSDVASHPLGDPPTIAETRRLEEIDRLLLETERMYPPVPYGPRGVGRSVEVAGQRLSPGPLVMYAIAATHRLPSLWREPGRFDPDRFAPPRQEHRQHPYALVGFGGGPRRCLGQTFARAELTVLVARVLHLYRLQPAGDEPVVQSRGVTVRPLGGMRLRAIPRAAVG